eukprot:216272_1
MSTLFKKKTNGISLNTVTAKRSDNEPVYHSQMDNEEINKYSLAKDANEAKMNDNNSEEEEEEEVESEDTDNENESNAKSDSQKLKKILNDVTYHEKHIKRNIKRLQKEYTINHTALLKADEIKKLLLEFDSGKMKHFEKYEQKRKVINGLLDSFQTLLLQTDLQQIQLKEENKKLKKENKILLQKMEISVQNE